MDGREGRTLLCVFAHPDDEAFSTAGSIIRYGAQGVKTALICATRGEAGEIADPALATPDTLGQVREGEMREAARIMGLDELIFLGYRDGTLANAGEQEVVGRLVREMRRLRPHVVITFDANGGYGHPDHMAAHRLTRAAFERAGDPHSFPGGTHKPYAPRKLYAVALSRSLMRQMRARMADIGEDLRPGGDAATIPLEEMGTPDERITAAIALNEAEYSAKLRVLAAHRTQMPADGLITILPPDARRAWLGVERFSLVIPSGAPGGSEHDLFAGL